MAADCGASALLAPYRQPGSEAIAKAVATLQGGSRAHLLANHGALIVFLRVEIAVEIAESLYLAAQAFIREGIIGTPGGNEPKEVERFLAVAHGEGEVI